MKRLSAKFLIFVLLVFMIISGVSSMGNKTKTQIAFSGQMEKSFKLEGMFARNEMAIKSPEKGILESKVGENEFVKKNKHIASVYVGNIDEEISKKLSEINKRINELNSQNTADMHVNDAHKIEEGITSKINDIIMASNARNAEKVSSLKEDLRLLADKKSTSAENGGDVSVILAELQSQKEFYEQQFNSNKYDLTAPTPGLYSSNIDGYEEVVNESKINTMTVAEYQTIQKKKITKEEIEASGTVCKIVNNYQWSLITVVNDSTASNLEIGQRVYIRFPSTDEEYTAKITYISPKESNRYLVSITSTEACDYSLTTRNTEFELICGRYSGLKIPTGAIQVINDKTGVYVAENSYMRFKEINVLYKDGKTAIVEQNNNKDNYLLLYDKIITHSKEYSEGKKIE